MSHGPREDVTQTLLTLLSGPGIPPLQQSATSPLLALKHMGNYMPMGRRVKSGADTRALSVFYGIASLPFSEGKPARLIPGRRIIGTAQGQGMVIIGGYRQVGGYAITLGGGGVAQGHGRRQEAMTTMRLKYLTDACSVLLYRYCNLQLCKCCL
jgi:hypothetical protein